MQKPTLLGIIVLTLIPTALIAELEPFRSHSAEINSAIEKIEQCCKRIPQLEERIVEQKSDLKDLASELKQLKIQRDRDINDLKSGRYCSKCNRTPSQILKDTKQTFEEHLDDVSGRSIPAAPSRILAEERKYQKAIASLQKKYDRASDKYSKSQTDLKQYEVQLEKAESEFRELDSNEKTEWATYQRESNKAIIAQESRVTGIEQTIRNLQEAKDESGKQAKAADNDMERLNIIRAEQRRTRGKLYLEKSRKRILDSELEKARSSLANELSQFNKRKLSEQRRYFAARGSSATSLAKIEESPFQSQQKQPSQVPTKQMTARERRDLQRSMQDLKLEGLNGIVDEIDYAKLFDQSTNAANIRSVRDPLPTPKDPQTKNFMQSVRDRLKRAGGQASQLGSDLKEGVDELKRKETELRRAAQQKELDKLLRDPREEDAANDKTSESYLEKYNKRLDELIEKARKRLEKKKSDLLKRKNGKSEQEDASNDSLEDSFDNFLQELEADPDTPADTSNDE
ncbi:hypothetical protein [uncultured Gimesia sp.]|uniref:hypothetical protein n=1 Tax=uncultured Gimesia sp. TaxID=1678688 RepID=UPI0030DA7B63